ncbi:MAG: T9SS type A sorting domain-containing protein [Ignavibacteriales bacterium]
MLRLNLVLAVLIISSIASAQTWVKLNPNFPKPDTVGRIAQITFTSKNIGWLYTTYDNTPHIDFVKLLYKTTDGGHNWETMKKEITNRYSTFTMFSLDPNHLITVDVNFFDSTFTSLRTLDGGESWDSTLLAPQKHYYSGGNNIYFFDKDNGIFFNDYRWYTSDGGRSWEKGEDNFYLPYVSDVDFVDRNLGWIVCSYSHYATDSGAILGTTDGGKTWQYHDSLAMILYGVDFITPDKGFAVGTNWHHDTGFIYSTIDGGKTWQHEQFKNMGAFTDIKFLNDTTGWIICADPQKLNSGKILKTLNGGKSWEVQVNGISSQLKKIMIKDNTGFIFGDDYNLMTHTLLRADLSNITGIWDEHKIIASTFSLSQNYPNPFNPITTISYSIPKASLVELKVFDMLGHEVQKLVSKEQSAGEYILKFDASSLPSGMYIYSIQAGDFRSSKKLLLLK